MEQFDFGWVIGDQLMGVVRGVASQETTNFSVIEFLEKFEFTFYFKFYLPVKPIKNRITGVQMPGIQTFLLPHKYSDILNQPFVSVEVGPENKTKVLLENNAVRMYFTYYDGYPFSQWQDDNQIILLEGMIYNQTKSKIETQLAAISRCFCDNGDYQPLVRAFVESGDGDFIVEIWDIHKERLLLFNNYWGRLPLYYYYANSMCGISREIKSLLSFIPEIKTNKTSLIEYLYFEFPLGNKTLFENIFRLGPASMLMVELKENALEFKVIPTADLTFDLNEVFSSRSKSVEVLKELFLQSVQSRVNALNDEGIRIAADLSGGFDSRTVLGGVEKFTHDVIYCTQKLNINDQRRSGQAVFEALGFPGKFLSAEPDHSYDMDKLGNFVFQYDCMANIAISFNSRQVITTLRELVPEKAARFMGMGGSEFLRHPLKAFRKSLIYGIDRGFYFYSNISLSEVCQLVGVNYHDYYHELEQYLKTYPEQTIEGQLKRLYFEYEISGADYGEDYCRKIIWTVCPLWGMMFMRAVVKRTPLEWTGLRFYTHFMKAIDSRLLQTPIYGKKVNLNSERSIIVLETQTRLETWIKAFFPTAHHFTKKFQARMNDYDEWKKIEPVIQDTISPLIQSIFPQGQTKFNGSNVMVSRRYLTLLLYLREIEAHYKRKISF